MKIHPSRTVFVSVVAFLFALLALASTTLSVAATTKSNEPDFAKIDAFVTAEMQTTHIPGLALGIVHGNQIMHLQGFGVADPTGRAITQQTPFIVGSVSKSFTALAIMQLVEAGKIELDAPVQRYLPWFRLADPAASTRITVRHLLYQTSGIPASADLKEFINGTGNETLEQLVRGLNAVALDRPVGTTHEYANTNYSVLGLIVQTVSGESYGTYIQQHIFTPLQMQHSFASQQEAKQDGLAQGYRWWFGIPTPTDLPYYRAFLPAGFLISSAEDMSHYLIMQMNGGRYGSTTILSPKGIATMHTTGAVLDAAGGGYAMGWVYVPPQESGVGGPLLYHNGETTGNFHSEMFILPTAQWGIILLTNVGDSKVGKGIQDHIVGGVINLLMGHEPPDAGLRASTLYPIVDGILVLISVLVLWSALRLPRWSKKFGQRRHRLVRLGFRLTWELILPLALLIGLSIAGSGSNVSWSLLLFNVPDLGWWLIVTLSILLITGIIRAVLSFRILRRKHAGTRIQAPSPSASLSLK